MPSYAKPYLTFDEQIELLESRGLTIRDRRACVRQLRSVGYYRLSGYWYPFRIRAEGHRERTDTPSDRISPGIAFEDIVGIYEFDRRLRIALWDALERVEVAIRVALAYRLGQYGPFAFLDSSFFAPGCHSPSRHNPQMSQFDEFRTKNRDFVLRSKEDFAKHFREQYGGEVPVWVAVELWDFGMLSRVYQIMKHHDREAMSRSFGIQKSTTMGGWLEAINILRNFCAHHARLNRRHFVHAPSIPTARHFPEFAHLHKLEDKHKHRLYPQLCVLSFLLNATSGATAWRKTIADHFGEVLNMNGASLADYGIPEEWAQETLWRTS